MYIIKGNSVEQVPDSVYYHSSRGRLVPIRSMADSYLINAYLSALTNSRPPHVTEPLGAEVLRRDLRGVVEAEAAKRAGA